MEQVRTEIDARNLSDNIFLGVVPQGADDSPILFKGKGNTILCEEGVQLAKPCQIVFEGDNATVVLRRSKHVYRLNAHIHQGCVMSFGSDNYFNGGLNIILSERRHLIVGNECLFAFGDWIRTADPHLIYDADTKQRINPSKDVLVGDHVWIGQDVLLLKGTSIGSGSIIGAKSLVSGKRIGSNASWAGNPARFIRDGLFWEGSCVHAWTEQATQDHERYNGDEYIFEASAETQSADAINAEIRSLPSSQEKALYIQEHLFNDALSNRFFIAG